MSLWREKMFPALGAKQSGDRGVYKIFRADDAGRPFHTFTAVNDVEARQIARQLMKGNGSAEVWAGKKLIDVI
jgi:hypothetical protein